MRFVLEKRWSLQMIPTAHLEMLLAGLGHLEMVQTSTEETPGGIVFSNPGT